MPNPVLNDPSREFLKKSPRSAAAFTIRHSSFPLYHIPGDCGKGEPHDLPAEFYRIVSTVIGEDAQGGTLPSLYTYLLCAPLRKRFPFSQPLYLRRPPIPSLYTYLLCAPLRKRSPFSRPLYLRRPPFPSLYTYLLCAPFENGSRFPDLFTPGDHPSLSVYLPPLRPLRKRSPFSQALYPRRPPFPSLYTYLLCTPRRSPGRPIHFYTSLKTIPVDLI